MTLRSSWQATRATVAARQSNKCAVCGFAFLAPIVVRDGAYDVVRTKDGYEAICRRCRCRRGSKARARRAQMTRRARRAQLPLPNVKRSKAA